jgi:hypothetical protein
MRGRQVQTAARQVLGSIGISVWALSVGGVGCGRTPESNVPEEIRQKLKASPVSAVRPTDLNPPDAAPAISAQEPVRRFAVRPFEEWTMRETAAAALGRIGKPAVPKLVEALKSSNPMLRHQAADTLARIGPSAAAAVPALIDAMTDQDPLVRKACARALGQIGPDAADAVPMLIEMLLEDDPHGLERTGVPE